MGWNEQEKKIARERIKGEVSNDTKGIKLEEILRHIMTFPEPRKHLELRVYIKHLGEVRDDSHYYRTCAKKLFKRLYGEEYREK